MTGLELKPHLPPRAFLHPPAAAPSLRPDHPRDPRHARVPSQVGLPARGTHSGAGITRRAANYLCFTNSKTLLRKVLRAPALATHRIVESHINYHASKPQKMEAVFKKYHEGDEAALRREVTLKSRPPPPLPPLAAAPPSLLHLVALHSPPLPARRVRP